MPRPFALTITVVLSTVTLAVGVASSSAGGAPDCQGPAPDAEPGSAAYAQREQDNDYCGEQRPNDTAANPAFAAALSALSARYQGSPPEEDPFRDPGALEGVRFRSQAVSFTNALGQQLPGRLFRPCDAACPHRPPGVLAPKPPYPGVIVVHGGSANQEMYLWGTEALAEAGYMVLTFQIPEPDNAESSFHYPNTKDALDYFTSTPSQPNRHGDVNPLWSELDRAHIGLAGHSAGGVAVSQLGQEDPRVSAIVSWDRAQSGPMPPGLKLRTPALFLVADFNCQRVPVCVPQPYSSPPDPKGPGDKDTDFQRLQAAGVDTEKIALRAATHLDFTQFPPGTGSRYGAVTASYYTLAWFDRYLRGAMADPPSLAADAFRRLTASRFDNSADEHNISGGTFDAGTGRNVPAQIAGQPVRDRLSFHFRSAWSFEHGRILCADIRAGCPSTAPPVSGAAPHRATPMSRRRCLSRRIVLVHFPRVARGDHIAAVTIRLGVGRERHVRLRRDRRVVVDLRGLPRRRVKVRITAHTARGATLRMARTLRTCRPAHRRGVASPPRVG